jgi:putative membrane protein
MGSKPEDDPRVYLAAERTFLAWLRTGLGLMGVGFAVARFGLFLREMQASQTHAPAHATGLSVWSGVALVTLGVVVNVGAVVRMSLWCGN